jgi:hypothetical protein
MVLADERLQPAMAGRCTGAQAGREACRALRVGRELLQWR